MSIRIREIKFNLRHLNISGFGIKVLEVYCAPRSIPLGRIHIEIDGEYVKNGLRFDLDKQIVFEEDILDVVKITKSEELKIQRTAFLKAVLPILFSLVDKKKKRR